MDDELEAIVQRMIDAGEPEEAIASVIREYQPATPESSAPMATAATGAVLGAAKAAPGIVSMVNKAAGPAAKLAQMKGMTPAIAAYDTVASVGQGNYKRAGASAAIGATTAAAPKVAGVIQRATNPSVVATRNALGRFATGGKAAGPVMRGAGVLSKLAGMAALPATLLSSFSDLQTLRQQLEAEVAARHPEVLEQREYFGGF